MQRIFIVDVLTCENVKASTKVYNHYVIYDRYRFSYVQGKCKGIWRILFITFQYQVCYYTIKVGED